MALGSAMYVWIAAFVANVNNNLSVNGQMPDFTWVFVVAGIWNFLLLIVIVVALVDAVLRVRSGKTRQLATNGLIVKLVSIPYFVSNFLVLAQLFVAGGVTLIVLIGFALWIVVAVGIALTYITMLSTSIDVWAAIARLRRERIIGTGLTVLYVILSLLFVFDIAAAAIVFGHSRRRPRLACAVLFLSVGAVFIAIGISSLQFLLDDGFGFGWSDPSFYLQWVIPGGVGVLVLLATGVVCVLRRSTLRLEAQQAALARRSETGSTPAEPEHAA
jgi:hypothetical protein